MSKKTVKIIAIIIACLMALGVIAPILSMFVFAENDGSSIFEELSEIEKEMNELSEKIYELNLQIEKDEDALDFSTDEVTDEEKKEAEQMKKFKDRVAVSCEGGTISYLGILFSSKSFSDLTERLVIAREITEYDKNILDSMNKTKNKIKEAKDKSNELLTQYNKKKDDLEKLLSKLQEQYGEISEYMSKLENNDETYKEYITKKEIEEKAAKDRAGIDEKDGSVDTEKISDDMLIWPTVSKKVSNKFENESHMGIDIGGNYGDSVVASASGKVILAEYNGGYGNCVILDHGNGINTLYGHMSKLLVKKGDKVEKGEELGRIGSSGNSEGPHLHFELLIDGTPVNAMEFFAL